MRDFNGYDSNIFTCVKEGDTVRIILKKGAFMMSTETSYLQDMLACIDSIEKDDTIKGVLVSLSEKYQGIENIESFIQSIKKEPGYVKKEMAVERYGSTVRRLTKKIYYINKPTIICITGKVPVDYFGYFMAFDFRVASHDVEIEFPGLKMGITPVGAASFFLSKQLGPTMASELFLSGKPLSAEDAYSLGLLSQLEESESIESSALNKLHELYQIPSLAYGATKKVLRASEHELDDHFERSTRFLWSSIIDKS